jgi:hypothetical protein
MVRWVQGSALLDGWVDRHPGVDGEGYAWQAL